MNRQEINRIIIKEISDYNERYNDLRFHQILANLDTDWEDKIEKHQLIPFFEKYLSDEKTYDELLLQIILFCVFHRLFC